MISDNSRYASNNISPVVINGRVRQTIIPRPPHAQVFNFTYWQWHDDDRVDLLAADLYGDDTLWWLIGEANPEILDWTSVEVGTVIRIPNV